MNLENANVIFTPYLNNDYVQLYMISYAIVNVIINIIVNMIINTILNILVHVIISMTINMIYILNVYSGKQIAYKLYINTIHIFHTNNI